MPAKLYVGNISSSCSQEELHSLFSRYGKVTELDIVKNFAFVHFEEEGDAHRAVRELHDSEFKGSKLQVQFSKNQDINRSNKHILKTHDKGSHRSDRSDRSDRSERSSKESHYTAAWAANEALRSRLPAERIALAGGASHRDHRAGLIAAANAMYRSKPYDRIPPQAAALPRYGHSAAAAHYRPSSRLAAYAEYYKAAGLAPAPVAVAAHLAPTPAAANPYAYYERLLDYKDPRVVAATPVVSPSAAYAAAYAYQSAAAKDPYTNAQIAYERYAGATSRAAAYANAYSAAALRSGYPPYR